MTARAPALLFVYGTLQDPARVEALIGAITRWRTVGSGSTRGRLYDVGSYPALIRAPTRGTASRSGDRVPGVLLELDAGAAALKVLDRYEGVDEGVYERRRCRVTTAAGANTVAWVYVYLQPVTGLRRIVAWPPS